MMNTLSLWLFSLLELLCEAAHGAIKRASSQSSDEPGGGREQGEDNHNDRRGGALRDGDIPQSPLYADSQRLKALPAVEQQTRSHARCGTRNKADKRQNPGLRPASGRDTATLKV